MVGLVSLGQLVPLLAASLIGGVRYLRSSPPLAGAFLIDLGAMVFSMPRALFPELAVTVYGGGAAMVGYLNAAAGLGALAGSLLTGHVWPARRPARQSQWRRPERLSRPADPAASRRG